MSNRKFEFTTDELAQINNNIRAESKSQPILDKDITIKLVRFEKSSSQINVEVENKSIKRDAGPFPAQFQFNQITRQRGENSYLEDDIRLLAGSEDIPVETALRGVLDYIKRTHAALNLQTNVYGQKAREANQHGFVAGVLDNFRYRHNARIYL